MNLQPINVNATLFKAKVGTYIDESQERVVYISKHNRKKSVLINSHYFETLKKQALKNYGQDLLAQARKSKLGENEILNLVLEAEKWAKEK